MENYRKIWKDHNGAIPLDENGVHYDIHHIDGNRNNNSIENLKAVSIQEHYDIHYKQQDWNACILIRQRLNLSKDEIKKINQYAAEKRKGIACPEDTKKKISKTLIGKKHSKERIDNIMKGRMEGSYLGKGAYKNKGIKKNNGRTGIKHSEEVKKKMSEAKKGKPQPDVSKRFKGIRLSNSHKEKLSVPKTEETKKKISESKKGKPWSEARILAQKQKKLKKIL